MPDGLSEHIRGCILGAALGDAMGAAFEFQPIERVVDRLGTAWIAGLETFEGDVGAHGVWRSPAPLGTGTDDTRYNWLVLQLAIDLERPPTPEDLARRMIGVFQEPERWFSDHEGLARDQFSMWEGPSRGVLGESSEQHPDVPPDVLRRRSIGLNFPTLIGLISLTTYGALLAGSPNAAYRAAFRADYVDVGYAAEAVGLLAAGVSAALTSDGTESVRSTAGADPLGLGGPFGGPFVAEHLPRLLDALPAPADDRQLAEHLSRELAGLHPFDPYKTVAVAFAAALSRPGDPLSAIRIAINHRAVQPDGTLGALQDIDCYGCVTGALAGALAGASAFPPGLLDRVATANMDVYGLDLETTVEQVIATFA